MSLFNVYFYFLFLVIIFISTIVTKLFPSRIKLQNIILIIGNLIFIWFSSWTCILIILLVSVITWLCGKFKHRIFQYIGILILVGILFFYKLADAKKYNIIIPIGVSFFIFNAISYLVDISKDEYESASFSYILLYLSFFPRLISGPLQKAHDFFSQIEKPRYITKSNVLKGAQIYCFGLFKKLVLADRLAIFVNEVYATPNAFSGLSIWLAVFSYSLQIYFDFSGYSDMAIGIGKMLGFDLPINFNMPYLSQNVTEFWRRWHISLSTWIRNYIYIPLGGNRKGKTRQNFNLLIAMTLCGLWHGATINFVLWGFIHGVALLVHKFFIRLNDGKIQKNLLNRILCIVCTFVFISLTWVLFRAENISQVMLIYIRIFSFAKGLNQPYFWSFIVFIIMFIVSFVLLTKKNGNAFYPILDLSKYVQLTLFFIFLGLIFALCCTNGSPFIYGAF